jgi:RHS repeat-associated protein
MKKLLVVSFVIGLSASLFLQRTFADGEENPVGVSGIYNGNVLSAGNYDPFTGNAMRIIDDILVPGSVGKYPLKWTRYWNSRTGRLQWSFSYDYGLDGWGVIASFPDGRKIDCSNDCPSGVEESMQGWDGQNSPGTIFLADGGKVIFEWHQDYISYKDVNGHTQWTVSTYYIPIQLIDPYGQVTTYIYDILGKDKDGNDIRRRSKIREPGGRYLQLVYDPNDKFLLTGVQAWDGQGNMTQSVTYTYSPLSTFQVLTRVDYSDGTFATYTYEMDGASPPGNYPRIVTCDDVRYGPMRQIQYNYGTSHRHIKSEKNLVTGEMVSQRTQTDQNGHEFKETRGDGPTRKFKYGGGYYNPKPTLGKLLWYTDFEGHTTTLGYDSGGFINSVTDANNHTTTYDRSGPAIFKITHPDSSFIQQDYGSYGWPFLAWRADERGNRTDYIRDPANMRITRKDYPDGGYETFQYNGFGQVTTHQMRNGAYQYFVYDSRGLLTDKWSPTWNSTRVDSDPKTHFDYYTASDYGGVWIDRVKRETDPLGNITEYEYDRRLVYSDPGFLNGQSTGDPCAGRGLVTKVTYPNDTHNGLYPNGTYRTSAYDKYGNKVWEEDELGQRTIYTYDDYKRLLTVTNPLGKTTTNTYTPTNGTNTSPYVHTTNSVYTTTTPTGIVTQNIYDANFRKTSTTTGYGTPQAATTRFDYDPVGNPTKATDPRGASLGDPNYTTTTDYDLRDRKWHVTDPQGHVTTFGYDAASNVTTITRSDQTVETKTYDPMNRMLTDTVPQDSGTNLTTTFVYNHSGSIYSVTDPKNQTTTFQYDPSDLKTMMIYPDNADPNNPTDYQSWTYDPAKNLIARRTVRGESQLFSYDSRHRELAMWWSNAADWANFDYDAASRMTTAEDATSKVVRQYDPANRLILDSQTLRLLPITAVSRKVHGSAGTFDIALPLIGTPGVECRSGGATNDFQLVVTFPRAVNLQNVSVTAGTGQMVNYGISNDGKQVTINLTGVTNAQTIVVTLSGVSDGSVTNDVKIGMGVLLGDTTGNGTVNSSDVNQTQSQTGQLVTSSNFREDVTVNGSISSSDVLLVQQQSGTALSAYSLTQSLPTNTEVDVQYVYDDDGKEQQLYVTSAGYGLTYSYDGMGRFDKILNRSNGTVQFQYSYDAASNEVRRSNKLNGLDQVYTPDNLNRITQRDVTLGQATISHEGYGYDPMRPGLMTSVDREDGKRDAFGYDLLPELTSAQYGLPTGGGTPQRQCSYTWDRAGNRATMTDSAGPSCTYGTTSLNQYWTTGNDPVTNGNEHELASYQNITYTYINDTHLSSISGNGKSYQLNYDALGRCAVRVLNGTTTYYIYDGEKPILEYGGGNQLLASNVYGKSIDEILMRTDYTRTPALTFYYQDDHEGSITHLTNSSGQIIESYRYDAFGAPTIKDENGNVLTSPTTGNPWSAYGNRFMFTGREYVSTFGIYEYRNRAYHPGLGRFMSEDPKLFDAGDYNLFRYVGNDPLDKTDPMGLDSVILAFPDFIVHEIPILGSRPWGHAGLLTIDNNSGRTHYYEYGRYDRPANRGIVRDYVPKNRVQVKDGQVNRASLTKVLQEVSAHSGQPGRVEGAYVRTDDKQQGKISAYAEARMADNNNQRREPYDIQRHSCNDFPREAVQAGGIKVPEKQSSYPGEEIRSLQRSFDRVSAPAPGSSTPQPSSPPPQAPDTEPADIGGTGFVMNLGGGGGPPRSGAP